VSCHTQEEIAARVGWERPTITGWIDDFVEFRQVAESDKAAANHATDFEAPIYNVWKQSRQEPSAPRQPLPVPRAAAVLARWGRSRGSMRGDTCPQCWIA
jgi:hypothetical protein